MASMLIKFLNGDLRILFRDDEQLSTAHKAIVAGMKTVKKFRNDEPELVDFEALGGTNTVKVEDVLHISLDLDANDEEVRKRIIAERVKGVKIAHAVDEAFEPKLGE